MAQYYLAKDGQRVGPMTVEQLLQNQLTPESLVWTEGMANWVKASEVPELASAFAPAQPVAAPAPAPAPQPQYQAPQPQYQAPQAYAQQPYQQQAPVGNYAPTPSMSFIDSIKTCLKKYATFSGRARRSEFWWFYLVCYAVNIIFYIPFNILMAKKQALINEGISIAMSGGDYTALESQDPTTSIIVLGIIWGLVMLALLIPQLSAMCRRLHDVGKSGHMMWLFLVCGVGGLVPLIMCIPDGKPQPNQYGESPKYKLVQ